MRDRCGARASRCITCLIHVSRIPGALRFPLISIMQPGRRAVERFRPGIGGGCIFRRARQIARTGDRFGARLRVSLSIAFNACRPLPTAYEPPNPSTSRINSWSLSAGDRESSHLSRYIFYDDKYNYPSDSENTFFMYFVCL